MGGGMSHMGASHMGSMGHMGGMGHTGGMGQMGHAGAMSHAGNLSNARSMGSAGALRGTKVANRDVGGGMKERGRHRDP